MNFLFKKIREKFVNIEKAKLSDLVEIKSSNEKSEEIIGRPRSQSFIAYNKSDENDFLKQRKCSLDDEIFKKIKHNY